MTCASASAGLSAVTSYAYGCSYTFTRYVFAIPLIRGRDGARLAGLALLALAEGNEVAVALARCARIRMEAVMLIKDALALRRGFERLRQACPQVSGTNGSA